MIYNSLKKSSFTNQIFEKSYPEPKFDTHFAKLGKPESDGVTFGELGVTL